MGKWGSKMMMWNEILFQIVLLISNTIQTITGFAGTLLAMPFSIKLVGIEETKAVLNIFTMMACSVIAIQNYRFINYKALLKMVAGMTVGMVFGIWLFEQLPLEMLLNFYAVLVILVALKKMFVKKNLPSRHGQCFLCCWRQVLSTACFYPAGRCW